MGASTLTQSPVVMAPLSPGAVLPKKPDPTKPAPPILKDRLPAYGTLEYLEKFAMVGLTLAALLYVFTRTLQGGAMRGIEVAASARGVRG